MRRDEEFDFSIETLGPCKIPSPIHLSNVVGDRIANYVTNEDFIRFRLESKVGEQYGPFKREQLIDELNDVVGKVRSTVNLAISKYKEGRVAPIIDEVESAAEDAELV